MKISVFLYGANFFFMQKDSLGWFADPKKTLDYIAEESIIVDAFYIVGRMLQLMQGKSNISMHCRQRDISFLQNK